MIFTIDDREFQADELGRYIASIPSGRRRIHFKEDEHGRPRTAFLRTDKSTFTRLDLDDSLMCEIEVRENAVTYLDVCCFAGYADEDQQSQYAEAAADSYDPGSSSRGKQPKSPSGSEYGSRTTRRSHPDDPDAGYGSLRGRIYVRCYRHADPDRVGPYTDQCTPVQGLTLQIEDREYHSDEQGKLIRSVEPGWCPIRLSEQDQNARVLGAFYQIGHGEWVPLEQTDYHEIEVEVRENTTTYVDLCCPPVLHGSGDLYYRLCGPGSLLDAITRVLKDETVTKRVVAVLEQLAAEAKRSETRGGTEHGGKPTPLTDLINRSLGTFAGRATEKADSPVCGGSLKLYLHSKGDPAWLAGANVRLVGPKKHEEVHYGQVHNRGTYIEFPNLPSGEYEGSVFLPPDVFLADHYDIDIPGRGKRHSKLRDAHSFEAEIISPEETVVHLAVRYRTRELEVIVFDDRADTAEPQNQPRIAGVPIEVLSPGGKVIACRNSDRFGCFRYPLHEPGTYMVQARSMVRVNGCSFRLIREGAIAVVSMPGERCPITVPIGYQRAGAALSLSLLCDDELSEQPEEAGSIEYGLFDDSRNLVHTGTLTAAAPEKLMDLEDKVYELILKSSETLEVCVPPQGFCRIKAVGGQFLDLSGGIHVRRRADSARTTHIFGDLRDANGIIAGEYLELVCVATMQTVGKSFTDENGQYSFWTDLPTSEVAFRVEGYSQLIPLDESHAKAFPAPFSKAELPFKRGSFQEHPERMALSRTS